MASADEGDSSGVRNVVERADVSWDSDAIPGVSMRITDWSPRGRPPDIDPLDLLGGYPAEAQHQSAVLALDGHAPRLAHRCGCSVIVGRRGVAVPRDHPRALAGIGRGDLLAEHRVQQRGLAGLDHAGDREPQRLVQAAVEFGDDA